VWYCSSLLVFKILRRLTKRGLPEKAFEAALLCIGRQQKSSPDKSEELSIF
jgi:hypothetical protein